MAESSPSMSSTNLSKTVVPVMERYVGQKRDVWGNLHDKPYFVMSRFKRVFDDWTEVPIPFQDRVNLDTAQNFSNPVDLDA
jgi:hypothetical protein